MTDHKPNEPKPIDFQETPKATPPSPASDDMPVERSSDSEEVEAHPS